MRVELSGEGDDEAITLPPYLFDAYQKAEDFCHALAQRLRGSGMLRTLLLRRLGSTILRGSNSVKAAFNGSVKFETSFLSTTYGTKIRSRIASTLCSPDAFKRLHRLFGQIPDVLEDLWIEIALGERDKAEQKIGELPERHPFELKYHKVQKLDWEKLFPCVTGGNSQGTFDAGLVRQAADRNSRASDPVRAFAGEPLKTLRSVRLATT